MTTNKWAFIDTNDYVDGIPPAQWPITITSPQSSAIVNELAATRLTGVYVCDRIILRAHTIDTLLGYNVIHVHEYDEIQYEDVLGFMYLNAA